VAKYREQHAELLKRFAELNTTLKRKKIETFEELQNQDQEAKKVLVRLAQETAPSKMQGINIALFGQTSTGKSTMLNALLGQNVAATGVGETTKEIKAYPGTGFTLWDVPGRNDEVSYLSMEYVAFFKGLTRRVILIQATVKENSSIMKLLDELGLQYDIVFNKFDKAETEEEQAQLKKVIRTEIQEIGLRRVGKVYFVSAKNPKMFDDWRDMVHHFTG
jgi:small GTP-binding protein